MGFHWGYFTLLITGRGPPLCERSLKKHKINKP